jgi:hypothetical protein
MTATEVRERSTAAFLSVIREARPVLRRAFTEEDLQGYVYVISNPAWPGYVKIGCAAEPGKRLIQFNTGSPFRDYSLHDYVYNTDKRRAEAHLHDHLRAYRVDGEWFKLDVDEAVKQLTNVRMPDPAEFMLSKEPEHAQ